MIRGEWDGFANFYKENRFYDVNFGPGTIMDVLICTKWWCA